MRIGVLAVCLVMVAGCGDAAVEQSAAPRPVPSVIPGGGPPIVAGDLVELVRSHCRAEPCAAKAAADHVRQLADEVCDRMTFVCWEETVLIPGAQEMRDCRRDCGCPALARRLWSATVEVITRLEDEYGGSAACEIGYECEYAEVGTWAAPSVGRCA